MHYHLSNTARANSVQANLGTTVLMEQRFLTWGVEINFRGAGEGNICGGQR